jgi:outer membrane protein assembly factor BamB
VTSSPLVARDVPVAGAKTIYVATSGGSIHAFAPNGYLRWEADLGQLARPCRQLDGYGVTGTPVIDPETRALYAADPFGRLHALDLATGAERAGWPVRVFSHYTHEHVFGGLLRVGRHVYVPTASFCDQRMEARLVRVSLATGETSAWLPVPFALGGGGGMWGFAGAAYSVRRGSIFVATGNAFRGGTNVGKRFKEWAGYGEQLVELSPDLRVLAASHPPDVNKVLDLDFSSAPVVAQRPGCPELVAAVNKNGTLYAWRADRVRAGLVWRAQLRRESFYAPVIGQPAWSPRHRSFYFATGAHLVRVAVTRSCRGRVAWKTRVPPGYTHGSPAIAGNRVWFGVSGAGGGLFAADARSGRIVRRLRLEGAAYSAPAVADGALFVGTFAGGLHAFVPRRTPGTASGAARSGRVSYADALHAWESRESGVYATDDGGATWRRILGRPAQRVARASARFGVVSTGSPAPRCACRPRVLWTNDGGRRWRETTAVGRSFVARGASIFWHDARRVVESRVAAGGRRLRSRVVGRVARGAIVDVAAVPGGAVALVSNRVRGQGWDEQPRVLVAVGGKADVVALPVVRGNVLVRSLDARWPELRVHARDFVPLAARAVEVAWTSPDGGRTWRVGS